MSRKQVVSHTALGLRLEFYNLVFFPDGTLCGSSGKGVSLSSRTRDGLGCTFFVVYNFKCVKPHSGTTGSSKACTKGLAKGSSMALAMAAPVELYIR
jgi:hypothetical protein